jgi:glycerol-3-phosphate dehydrogenase subunit B
MRRLTVVGAGLSGLTCALFAAQRGAEVTLVATGRGGLSLSHAGIELWASASPSRSIARLKEPHPYALAGSDALRSGLKAFREPLKQTGFTFEGGISSSRELLTAAGSTRLVSFAPAGAATREEVKHHPTGIAVIPGLRDYFPELIARNAARFGLKLQPLIELPVFDSPQKRSFYALDLARRFEDKAWRQETLRAWKPKLTGINRLVFPACLGLESTASIRAQFADELGLLAFEVALPPPTVPGLRLESALLLELDRLEVQRIEGASAIGRFDGRSGGKTTSGLVLETAGTRHSLDAEAVILATGGVLHGGLQSLQTQGLREAVYQIPVQDPTDRRTRVAPSPFGAQAYAGSGIHVNARMQPLDSNGQPFLENLFAAGGIIGGADRTREGDRQGIDIATAYKATQSALRLLGLLKKPSNRKKKG